MISVEVLFKAHVQKVCAKRFITVWLPAPITTDLTLLPASQRAYVLHLNPQIVFQKFTESSYIGRRPIDGSGLLNYFFEFSMTLCEQFYPTFQ